MSTSAASPGRPESAREDSGYQWLLDYHPDSPSVFGGGGHLPAVMLTELAVAAVLSLPPVVAATGVGVGMVALLVGGHALTVLFNVLVLGSLARRSRAAFHVGSVLDLTAGLVVVCAFPALSGNPNTLLWSLPIMYAALDGGIAESRPSRLYLLLHVLAPLATIPFFDGDGWAAGPLLGAGLSGVCYHFMAMRVVAWRGLSARHEAAQTRLRAQQEELSRMRLARDLHDGVGSALGLLALHADLLERHKDDPEQVLRLASLAREAARGGLDDLRGVLEAVAPEEDTLGAAAAALEELARRTAPGVEVSVRVAAGAEHPVSAAERLALVRTFQEALRNAVVHGGAGRVAASLDASGGLLLEVQDDGFGFDPAAVRAGRGLAGMRARAQELGGTLDVRTRPGAGATVRLSVPPQPQARAS